MKRATFIFILLSGLASFLNYVMYPALSRILDDRQFVSITVALAIFTQLSSFTLSIVALTIGLSKIKGDKTSSNLIEKLQAVLIHLFAVLLMLFLIVSPRLFGELSLSLALLAPIALMLALSIIMSVVSGYLNGKGKLVKLGITLVITALLQLALSILASLATKSGTITLYAMCCGTILSLVFIYSIYRHEGLPRLSSVLIHRFSIYRSPQLRSLLKFIIAASLSTLAINILLIIDLLVINSRQQDSKIYADIYVISRIVFFGGMLFVWPFLSNIDIYKPKRNIKLLLQLLGIFLFITVGSVVGMQLFGEQITRILLGSQYQSWDAAKELVFLAILYKFNFLIITALVLFFIVIRSYWAIGVSMIVTVGIAGFLFISGPSISSVQLVQGLNAISSIAILVGMLGFFKATHKPVAQPRINVD